MLKHEITADPGALRVCRQVTLWSLVSVAVVCLLVLFGWVYNISILKQVLPRFPPMVPNTAIALLVGAVSFLAHWGLNLRWTKWVTQICGLAIFSFGLVALFEHRFGWQSGIDEVFFAAPDLSKFPGRPSAEAAIAFTFLGAALFAIEKNTRKGFAVTQFFAYALAAFSMLVVISYFTRASAVWVLLLGEHGKGMALNTGICFAFFSCALLLAYPEKGFGAVFISPTAGGVVARRIFFAAVFGPLIVGTVLYVGDELDLWRDEVGKAFAAFVIGLYYMTLIWRTARGLDRMDRLRISTVDALTESEERYKQLIEDAPEGVFIADFEGRYIQVNKAGVDLLGLPKEEILGKTIFDFIPPEEVALLLKSKAQMLEPGQVHVGAWHLKAKGGIYIPVEVSAKILSDGRWQGFVRDVSARQKLEVQTKFLSESARVLSESTDFEVRVKGIAKLVVPVLADFCTVYILEKGELVPSAYAHRNPEIEAIHKKVLTEYKFRKVNIGSDFVLHQNKPFLAEHVTDEMLRAISNSDAQYELLLKMGIRSFLVVPMIARDKLIGTLSMAMSESERTFSGEDIVFAEIVASRFAMILDNSRLFKEAQNEIKIREQILSIVSHDLKTPLTAIQLNAQMLARSFANGIETGPLLRFSKSILQSTSLMFRLISSIMDLSKVQAGTFSVQLKLGSPRDTLKEVLTIGDDISRKAGLTFETEIAEDLPPVLHDAERISQVLLNLLGNAVKFTARGGKVKLSVKNIGRAIQFQVSDTGVGIPKEHLSHVFEEFWQWDGHGSFSAGLGLFIAKEIVSAHKGHIWVESTVNKGSDFYFSLPIGQSSEKHQDSGVPTPQKLKSNERLS